VRVVESAFRADELAERRVARHGANGLERGGGEPDVDRLQDRLTAAEHELAVLQARLGETVAERDRAAGLAARRRDEVCAARERGTARGAEARAAESALAAAREQLGRRTASEAALRVEATGMRARVDALRAQVAGHDGRLRELSRLVEELAGTASAARADVERHLAARAEAEAELADARRRIAVLEDELAAERGRLEALCAARERTLSAQARAEGARGAELAALRAAGERLRPAPVPAPSAEHADLVLDLGRAAERLRLAAAAAPGDPGDARAPGEEQRPAVEAGDPPAPPAYGPSPAGPPPAVMSPAAGATARPPAGRAGRIRRLLRRLRG
jgi:chemotaxis protein MotB